MSNIRLFCCEPECNTDAEWEIWWGVTPDDNTLACTVHVGSLLNPDTENRVSPVEDLPKPLEFVRFSVHGVRPSQVACEGRVQFVCEHDPYWGSPGRNYQSDLIGNPTWAKVAELADDMVRTVNDKHHIFLEGVVESHKEGEVTIFKFQMGS